MYRVEYEKNGKLERKIFDDRDEAMKFFRSLIYLGNIGEFSIEII